MLCYKCNSEMEETRGTHHYIESGLNNVYLEGIPINKCGCGEILPKIPSIIKTHRQIGSAIIKKQGALTGDEIKFLRKNLRLKSIDFATFLGVDKSTFSRWETTDKKQSKSNDKFIRILYAILQDIEKHEIREILEVSGSYNNQNITEDIRLKPGLQSKRF